MRVGCFLNFVGIGRENGELAAAFILAFALAGQAEESLMRMRILPFLIHLGEFLQLFSMKTCRFFLVYGF